jgi:low temperature requirement protein LtrA
MAKHLGTAQEAQSTHLRAALFIVVGALLVVASVVFEKNKQTTMQSVALNLGLVSISIVLLDYL